MGAVAGLLERVDTINDTPADRQPDDAGRRRRAYLLGVVGLQVVCLVVVLSRSWFSGDDFLNFSQVREEGLTYDFLRHNIFGHLAPGHRLLDWFVFEHWPLEWWAAVVMLVGMLVATTLVLDAILRHLAPESAWPTLLLAIWATSPLVMGSAIWWAAAGHFVPGSLFSCLAVLAALRYGRRPSWSDALLYTVALVAALLCFEKAVLTPLGVAVLLWAIDDDRGVAALRGILRRCAPLVVLTVVVVGLFAAAILFGNYNENAEPPDLTTWWEWTKRLVVAGPFAGLLGVSPDDYSGAARQALLLAAGTAILVVLAWTLVRFRDAWRGWMIVTLWFLPAVALTAYGRAEEFGPGIASDFHYPGELAFVAPIALTVACRRPRPRPRHRQASPGREGWVALALVPVVVLSFVSDLRYVDRFGLATSRDFVDNLQRSAAELDLPRTRDEFAVLDVEVPLEIVPPAFAPFNRASYVLELLPATRGLSSEVTDGRIPILLRPDGRLLPAGLAEVTSLTASGDECLAPTLLDIPRTVTAAGDETLLFVTAEGWPRRDGVNLAFERESEDDGVGVKVRVNGGPVRLRDVEPGTFAVRAQPDACLSRLTLLTPRPS